ncbi:MAG TPA: porin, partial [Urbifossiella sp.]
MELASVPMAPAASLPATLPPITPGIPLTPTDLAPPFGGPNPPSVLPPAPGSSAELRLRSLEQQNADLNRQLIELSQQQQLLLNRMNRLPVQYAASNYDIPGQLGRPRQQGVVSGEEREETHTTVDLSKGLRFTSSDGLYKLEIHDLTQGEFRGFGETSPSSAGQGGLHDNFDIPRQRLYFAGSFDHYFDFYSVLNRGYGSLDVLDSYVNFKADSAFNVRMGRTKTPYGYEYYKIAEGDLIGPERSVFVGNLSPNRQIGMMAFGRLLNETVEYAAGVFNGPHRSFQDFNNDKMVALYLNTKPFLYGGSDLVRQLNLGASVNFQRSNDPLEPSALHTANDETVTSAANNVSPTFLQFNPAAIELGNQAFWSGDIAWYYRSLTSLIMYNGGFITYGLPTRTGIQVPFEGGSVAFTYFLTGEEIITRKEVEPLRDFDLKDFINHPGAFELYTRVGILNAGSTATSSGLVDPRMWSRSATVLDSGVNWYMNRFVRIFMDWQ